MADSIKDGCWPKSAHISYARNALLLWHTYVHICTYIYIYIYCTNLNVYTPNSVSLASLAH